MLTTLIRTMAALWLLLQSSVAALLLVGCGGSEPPGADSSVAVHSITVEEPVPLLKAHVNSINDHVSKLSYGFAIQQDVDASQRVSGYVKLSDHIVVNDISATRLHRLSATTPSGQLMTNLSLKSSNEAVAKIVNGAIAPTAQPGNAYVTLLGSDGATLSKVMVLNVQPKPGKRVLMLDTSNFSSFRRIVKGTMSRVPSGNPRTQTFLQQERIDTSPRPTEYVNTDFLVDTTQKDRIVAPAILDTYTVLGHAQNANLVMGEKGASDATTKALFDLQAQIRRDKIDAIYFTDLNLMFDTSSIDEANEPWEGPVPRYLVEGNLNSPVLQVGAMLTQAQFQDYFDYGLLTGDPVPYSDLPMKIKGDLPGSFTQGSAVAAKLNDGSKVMLSAGNGLTALQSSQVQSYVYRFTYAHNPTIGSAAGGSGGGGGGGGGGTGGGGGGGGGDGGGSIEGLEFSCEVAGATQKAVEAPKIHGLAADADLNFKGTTVSWSNGLNFQVQNNFSAKVGFISLEAKKDTEVEMSCELVLGSIPIYGFGIPLLGRVDVEAPIALYFRNTVSLDKDAVFSGLHVQVGAKGAESNPAITRFGYVDKKFTHDSTGFGASFNAQPRPVIAKGRELPGRMENTMDVGIGAGLDAVAALGFKKAWGISFKVASIDVRFLALELGFGMAGNDSLPFNGAESQSGKRIPYVTTLNAGRGVYQTSQRYGGFNFAAKLKGTVSVDTFFFKKSFSLYDFDAKALDLSSQRFKMPLLADYAPDVPEQDDIANNYFGAIRYLGAYGEYGPPLAWYTDIAALFGGDKSCVANDADASFTGPVSVPELKGNKWMSPTFFAQPLTLPGTNPKCAWLSIHDTKGTTTLSFKPLSGLPGLVKVSLQVFFLRGRFSEVPLTDNDFHSLMVRTGVYPASDPAYPTKTDEIVMFENGVTNKAFCATGVCKVVFSKQSLVTGRYIIVLKQSYDTQKVPFYNDYAEDGQNFQARFLTNFGY